MYFQKIKNIFHLFEAVIASIYFGFPSRKLKVIGVTGTDGKTTTTHLIYHILKSSGKKVSMISSIYAEVGGKIFETGLHTTTPRPWNIQSYLKKAVDNHDEYFILETTSHAIDQNRVWGVSYYLSILTNITHDHLYHHGTFENYLKIKVALLLRSKKVVINTDDASFNTVKSYLDQSSHGYVTYGLKNKATYIWSDDITTQLMSEYNKQNILAAYVCCREIHIDTADVIAAIKTFSLPKGRFEIVYDVDFTVVIDFAHTPNAILNVLQAVKDECVEDEDDRIIHIFGAAAERDNSKRPKMGENSGLFADIVILTEEDYRKENINKICDEIAEGLSKENFTLVTVDELKKNNRKKVYCVVPNRKEAIELGISLAKDGDIVICTGKSHEKSLNRKGIEYSWDEYGAIKQALQAKQTPRVGLGS